MKMLVGVLIAAILMIILAVVYVLISMFVIKAATDIVFDDELSANFGAIATAIVTFSAVIAGAMAGRE